MLRSLVAAGCGLLLACGSVPEAPQEIGAATRFLFEQLDQEEESVVSGILALEAATAHLQLEADLDRRAFGPPLLLAEHLGTAKSPPDTDPNDQYRVAVAGLSRHPVANHRKLVIQTDLLPVEAEDTPLHSRMITSGTAACFADGSCPMIETLDHLRKNNFLFDIPYDLKFQIRAVKDENGRVMMVERAWMEAVGVGEDSSKTIDQHYRLKAWWPDPDGKRTRIFSAVWMILGVFGATEGIFIDEVTPEIDGSFKKSDDFIDTL